MKGIGCRGDKLNETKSVKTDCLRGQANHRLVRLTADSQRVGQAGKIVVVENSDFISFPIILFNSCANLWSKHYFNIGNSFFKVNFKIKITLQ